MKGVIMIQTFNVFVYGTLRQHEENSYFLHGAKCLSSQCWTYGILYDTGCGYPAMETSRNKKVYGELYQVNHEQLKRLDHLEGYEGDEKDNLYDRITQTIYTDTGTIQAYVYVFLPDQTANLEKISFGDWKCHRYIKQDELYYFAYGSCMDDERFQLAGVEMQFEHVVGCGIANNFSLAYTRKAHDGGRADLIESGEQVEGKVYQIEQKTLHYLFKREGVHAQIYRPAFIEVTINGTLYQNVLTFLVIEKEEETAPPEHYAIEILRGAKGFVSEEYYKKLQSDLAEKFGLRLN